MLYQFIRYIFVSIFVVIFTLEANAAIEFGTGITSATGGRLVPSLNLGFGTDSFELLVSSSGVSSSIYSSSTYTLGAFWTWNAGDFIFGKIISGFGLEGLYAVHSFKDIGSAKEKKSEFYMGPAFFSQWQFLGPFYFAVEAIYGINLNNLGDIIALNARDHINLIFGVRL